MRLRHLLRLFLWPIVVVLCVISLGVTPATANDFENFAIKFVAAGESTHNAGAHPDVTTTFEFTHDEDAFGNLITQARVEDIEVALPPGLLGNPQAIPRCSNGSFLLGNCPFKSQIGVVEVLTIYPYGEFTAPLYNLEPTDSADQVARLGFSPVWPVFIDVFVRTAGDYGVTARVENAPSEIPIIRAVTTIWGNPADPVHDPQRMTPIEGVQCPSGTACETPEGKRSSEIPPTVFMTNPSTCEEQQVGFAATSYELPGRIFRESAALGPIEQCQGLPFEPAFELQPTSRQAGAPTGLKATLHIPQREGVDEVGTSTMREARVTLPEGLSIASGAADGIGVCSEEQVGLGREVEPGCPDNSKLGIATIVSPALSQPVVGVLYQRTPVPGHLFRIWLTADEFGLHVKLSGEIRANPQTGQLTAVFTDLPQVPVEEIKFEIRGGARAPLKNPDSCGTYATRYSFTPWSNDPAVIGDSKAVIDEACGGGGFAPKLWAGAVDPVAGSFSPFILDVRREDGEQNLASLDISLPKGELAKLAGVPLCDDAGASSGTCPPESKIGSVTVAVGPGTEPLWIPQPGKAPTAIYLAGPYKGAPLSVVTVVPAQAGPFDLGTVAIRSQLQVDSETAVASVKTDPLPQFLEGVPVIYRTVHAAIDRPEFSLNPTNCQELAVNGAIGSVGGAVAHPGDRFQVDGCKRLKFRPRLALSLKGGTNRGQYPALTAVLKARKGDANIRRASVALPHSVFLAQEHIVTICTRVQFAADSCPKGSIYGTAKAWTPLLDKPVEGPVYLRSSSHPLPDLVVALHGQVDIALVGRIDSHNGGIRTIFNEAPDAPVTRFELRMESGRKGLLMNSRNACRSGSRASVKLGAQNGRTSSALVPLRRTCRKTPIVP